MVDTWATVASCAQIGRNVHLSGGVGIGGVLEPRGGAGRRRGRRHDRQSMHGHAGGAKGSGSVLGEGDPEPRDPCDRCRDRRRAPAASCRRTASASRLAAVIVPGRRVHACRACSCSAATSRASGATSTTSSRVRRHRLRVAMTDLLALTAELVDVSSVSRDEAALRDLVEQRLRAVPWSAPIGSATTLVGRTELDDRIGCCSSGTSTPFLPTGTSAGRTAMSSGPWRPTAKGWRTRRPARPGRDARRAMVDVSYVFYAAEEIAAEHNGLRQLFADRPDLVAGDAAILGEPTEGVVEAGWPRHDAHRSRLGRGTSPHRSALDGPQCHPPARASAGGRRGGAGTAAGDRGLRVPRGATAVRAEGGVAGNVVPDRATVANHRFAPDRTPAEAEAAVRSLLAPVLDDGDELAVVDVADGAAPGLGHPLLAPLVERPAAGAGEARLDRRRPLRRCRHPRLQHRARRSSARSHSRRAGRPRVARVDARRWRRWWNGAARAPSAPLACDVRTTSSR